MDKRIIFFIVLVILWLGQCYYWIFNDAVYSGSHASAIITLAMVELFAIVSYCVEISETLRQLLDKDSD